MKDGHKGSSNRFLSSIPHALASSQMVRFFFGLPGAGLARRSAGTFLGGPVAAAIAVVFNFTIVTHKSKILWPGT